MSCFCSPSVMLTSHLVWLRSSGASYIRGVILLYFIRFPYHPQMKELRPGIEPTILSYQLIAVTITNGDIIFHIIMLCSHISARYLILLNGLSSIYLWTYRRRKQNKKNNVSPAGISSAADNWRPESVSASTWIKCTAGTERACGLAF